MSIETITDTPTMSVFKDDAGTTYVVQCMEGSKDPESLVNDPKSFIYGGCEVDGDEGPEPFDTALAYIETHGWDLTTEEIPALFRGELCRAFKSGAWKDFDWMIDHYQVWCVSKKLGTAEEWARYQLMWEECQVWQLTDTSNGNIVTNIYAYTAREALELYLEKGAEASLKVFADRALGRN